MTVDIPFDLGCFITDSLSLQSNTHSQLREHFPKQFINGYEKYFRQEPLDLIGERVFKEAKTVYKDVKGTDIQEFYRDAHILITGGTGFLGKLLTEKLVRSVPHLGHIYLLIRTKRGKDPQERLEKLLEEKVFRRMREEVPWYHSKVTAVAGDLYEPGLGLSAEDRQLLTDKVHVVFHIAADVKFTQPLKVALEANVFGSRRVMDLASRMTGLKACVYVSTAFSQCVRRVIPESVPRMNIPYKDILNHIEALGDDPHDPDLIRLMQGWPNTYTFSKALCEIMLDEEYQTLPLSIFRPSVILPTYKEPVRGWTDNLYGPLALLVGAGHGVIHTFHLDEELSLDIVPADYVINGMLTVGKATGQDWIPGQIKVFNYTTQSPQRVRSWKHFNQMAKKSNLRWPFNNVMWAISYQNHSSRCLYLLKHFVFHKIPAWVVDKVLVLRGEQPRLMKICQKVDEIYPSIQYFVSHPFEFQNDNVKQLWDSLSNDDKSLFDFDTDHYDILENVIVSTLGIKYYYLKEGTESISTARRRIRRLYWLHNAVKATFWFGVLTVAARLARPLPL